eukprot:scaffold243312_cov22-Prasinocladus_malaysianus.AAC.1
MIKSSCQALYWEESTHGVISIISVSIRRSQCLPCTVLCWLRGSHAAVPESAGLRNSNVVWKLRDATAHR